MTLQNRSVRNGLGKRDTTRISVTCYRKNDLVRCINFVDSCTTHPCDTPENKPTLYTRKDIRFLHAFALEIARAQLPHLRALARQDYPDLPLYELIVCIDFLQYPPVLSLEPLGGYYPGHRRRTSDFVVAQNDEMEERVKQNKKVFTMLESYVTNGRSYTHVTNIVGRFWFSDDEHAQMEWERRIGVHVEIHEL